MAFVSTLNRHLKPSFSLILFIFLYSTVILASNIVGQKPLEMFGFIVSAGSTIFPLTFVIIAIITEIYGRVTANYVIFLGLVMNLLVAVYINATVLLPPPSFWGGQGAYEVVMRGSTNIFILSSFAYILSEYSNVYIFTTLSRILKLKLFLLRFFIATLSAVVIDTLALLPIILKSSPSISIVLVKLGSLISIKMLFILCFAPVASIAKKYVSKLEAKRIANIKSLFVEEQIRSMEKETENKVSYIFDAKRG